MASARGQHGRRPRKWLREHVSVLLGAYERFPVLYESKCEEYYDRVKRDAALATIAADVSVYRTRTTPDEVKTKIKTLRSQYTTEKAAIATRNLSGVEDPGYEPKLWCFNDLKFLDDHVKMRSSPTAGTAIDDDAVASTTTTAHGGESTGIVQAVINSSKEKAAAEVNIEMDTVKKPPAKTEEKPFRWMRDVENLATFRVSQIKAQMAQKAEEKKLELLTKVHQDALEYKREMAMKEEDQHDIFGKYVASELRQITDQQIYFRTKRSIQDALTDGHENMLFGQVTASTVYCTLESDNSSLEPIVTATSPSPSDHDNLPM